MRSLVILGAGGDLTSRLLLPGLAALVATGRVGDDIGVVGSGRRDREAEFRQALDDALDGAGVAAAAADALRSRTRWRCADGTDPDDVRALLETAAEVADGPPAFYLATPPAVAAGTVRALAAVGLPDGSRIAVEKPFGTDEETARDLNHLLTDLLPEEQVHRVDHFLGKDTVLNLLGLRFANRLFEPVWNAEHVERVDVIWEETLGLEGRADYYDSAGALVDMVQSHLLHVLALLAMEPPARLDARDLRDATAEVLDAVRAPQGEEVDRRTGRGRWTAGTLASGDRVPAYVDADGVDPARDTETWASIEVDVDLPRWRGVPFRLVSGKGLARDRKEIVVTFRASPWVPAGMAGTSAPTRLRIGMSDPSLGLELSVNGPGDPHTLGRAELHSRLGDGVLPPYGEVLEGIFGGDPLLSVRGDAAQRCWRIVQPVLDGWRAGRAPMWEYPAGSDGPADAATVGGAA